MTTKTRVFVGLSPSENRRTGEQARRCGMSHSAWVKAAVLAALIDAEREEKESVGDD